MPALQDLDEARHQCSKLQRERDQLQRDNALMRSQCEDRSAHMMVLLDSNHRWEVWGMGYS